ncbi:hypothetical protein ACFVGV_16600 [Pseudarthrobacter scleromae]|uniref:hypothetical protein n=1 Tax=Pseudarthrobacter scleromae TaxID=158897 RepID=UPI003635EA28
MRWIVDITRAAFDSELDTLKRVQSATLPTDDIHVVHRQEQTVPDAEVHFTSHEVPADVARDEESFLSWTSDLIHQISGPTESLILTSYWSPLEALVSRVNSGRVVEYRKLGALLQSKAAAAKDWDSNFMTKQVAADYVVWAVGASPSGKLHITSLRGKVQALSEAFNKEQGGFPGRQGFISRLAGVAQEQGFIDSWKRPGHPDDDILVLTPLGRTRLRLIGPTPTPTPTEARKASLALKPAVAEQVILTVADQQKTRSQDFITALRNQRMGPFQQVRLAIIREIGTIACEAKYGPVEVIDRALRRVRESEPASSLKDFANLPWPRIRAFMRKLLSMSPVLLSHDEPITGGWGETSDRVVTGVAPKFDVVLDGELVVALVRQGLNISQDDEPDLAGALYNSRDEEYLRLVDHVVRHLLASKILREEPSTQKLILH